MTEHPNAKRIRDLFEAFGNGDVAAIEDVIAQDAVWHFPGRAGRLAGSHRGREAIFAFLGRVMELTDATFGLDLEDVLAGEKRAVALFRGHGMRGDKTLDNPTCLVIHLKDGKATEIREFVWNLFEVDDFWS